MLEPERISSIKVENANHRGNSEASNFLNRELLLSEDLTEEVGEGAAWTESNGLGKRKNKREKHRSLIK